MLISIHEWAGDVPVTVELDDGVAAASHYSVDTGDASMRAGADGIWGDIDIATLLLKCAPEPSLALAEKARRLETAARLTPRPPTSPSCAAPPRAGRARDGL